MFKCLALSFSSNTIKSSEQTASAVVLAYFLHAINAHEMQQPAKSSELIKEAVKSWLIYINANEELKSKPDDSKPEGYFSLQK